MIFHIIIRTMSQNNFRSDFPEMKEDWKCFANCRWDPDEDTWELIKKVSPNYDATKFQVYSSYFVKVMQ